MKELIINILRKKYPTGQGWSKIKSCFEDFEKLNDVELLRCFLRYCKLIDLRKEG